MRVGGWGEEIAQHNTTYLLIPLLLPLRDEHGIGVAVLEQPVVQGLRDGLLLVVELVDVAAALVGDLEDGPLDLVLRHVGRRRVLRVLHLDREHLQVVPDVVEPRRRLLLPRRVRPDRWHLLVSFPFVSYDIPLGSASYEADLL